MTFLILCNSKLLVLRSKSFRDLGFNMVYAADLWLSGHKKVTDLQLGIYTINLTNLSFLSIRNSHCKFNSLSCKISKTKNYTEFENPSLNYSV